MLSFRLSPEFRFIFIMNLLGEHIEPVYRIQNLADIEALEKVPLQSRILERNTYALLEKGAQISPQAR